ATVSSNRCASSRWRTCSNTAPAGPTTGSPAARPAVGSTGAARMPGGWRPSWRGRQPAEPRARLDVVVQVKRVYDAPDASDGKRVLVDRLWPRGLRKDAAALHDWLRDVAPSEDLRRWYRHEPARFAEFAV